MVRSRPYRLVAFFLASMMLLTSFTYSLDVHYCQGQFMGMSLIGATKSCHTQDRKCAMHQNTEATEAEKKNCCQNEHVVIEDIVEDYCTAIVPSLSDLQFVVAFIATSNGLAIASDTSPKVAVYRPPPLLRNNYQILYQSYLL